MAVTLLAGALRAMHLDWGLPDYYFPDEAVFFRPATRIAATGDLHTGFTTYPPLTVNVLAATYALAARARGVPPTALSPAARVRVGRRVMLAAAVATVPAVAALGTALAGPAAGLVAALFVAVLPTHVVQTRIISTDVLLTLLVVLALLAALRLSARPSLGRALACGAAVGLAAGTKYPGALVAVAPAVVCLSSLAAALAARDGRRARRWLLLGAAAALAAPLAFTAAYPHWLRDLPSLADRLRFLRFVAHEVGNEIARLSPAGGLRGTPVAYQLAILFPAALGVPLWLLAVPGVARLARRGGVRAAAVLAVALAWFAFFATAQSVFPRYYLPLLVVLAVAAAAWTTGGGRWARLRVGAGALAAAYGLALAASLGAHTGTEPQRALRAAIAERAAGTPAPPSVGFVLDRFGDYTGVRAALRGLPIRPVPLILHPDWLAEERPDLLVVSDVDAVVAHRNHPGSPAARTLDALAAGELPYRLVADVRVDWFTRALYVAFDPYFGFAVERGAVGFRLWARTPGA